MKKNIILLISLILVSLSILFVFNYINNKKDMVFEIETMVNKYLKDTVNVIVDGAKERFINDNEAPDIEASDIVINLGDTINIKDKVICNDLVDGEVECIISGEYNFNEVGTYVININAVDKAGNISNKSINLIVKKVNKNPYYIEIIRNYNTVIVYGLDNHNEYTNIIKVFPCSVGVDDATPLGTFETSPGYEWGSLYGGVYAQYSTRIHNDILFHSVPYYSMSKDQLEWEEFNKLGEPASMGCIRMTVSDVKWIYDNCSNGVTVKIYDGDLPDGISKPYVSKIDGDNPNRGWDPTDPDSNNPWNN